MISSFLFALILPLLPIQNPYCDLYGVMYEVYSKKEADFIVFEESSESFADILIYDQDNQLYADKPGHWHFVNKKNQARYRLYFTDDPDEAHFSVFFTETESFAGCNE